jgi:hypothetical protein
MRIEKSRKAPNPSPEKSRKNKPQIAQMQEVEPALL